MLQRYEKGILFSSEVSLDEFTDLDAVYSDLKFLHILEIEMKNRYTLILMRLKGGNVLSWQFLQIQPLCVHICAFCSKNTICRCYSYFNSLIWILFGVTCKQTSLFIIVCCHQKEVLKSNLCYYMWYTQN